MNTAIRKIQRLDRQMRSMGAPTPARLRPAARERAAETTGGLPEYPADVWAPFPERADGTPSPQQLAYDSPADELYYGGGAGGGKSDLLLGLALTAHRKALVFRRTTTQVETLEERVLEILGGDAGYNRNQHRLTAEIGGVRRRLTLGGMQREKDWQNYQGKPNDLVGFDELPHFLRSQYRAIVGWNRTNTPGQRTRVVGAGNPPVRTEEMWVIDEFAPWLDPEFRGERPEPGELRWYYYLDGKPEGQDILWLTREDLDEETGADGEPTGRLTFVPDPEAIDERTGEPRRVAPMSRTFVPALVEDNPVYMASGYADRLDALPEPLRSLMRKGAFDAAGQDDEWQVVPTAWVDAAQARWLAVHRDADGNPVDFQPEGPLTALGVDPARGGKDAFARAPRWGDYFGETRVTAGEAVSDGPTGAALVVADLDELATPESSTGGALVVTDVIGIGGSVWDSLEPTLGAWEDGGRLVGFDAGGKGRGTDQTGKLRFVNARSQVWWLFREALNPKTGGPDGGPSRIALPPSRTVKADLCAPRWKLTPSGILIEPKVGATHSRDWGIRQRLGRSTNEGDAIVQTMYEPPPPERQSALIDDWADTDALPEDVLLTDW